MRRCGEGSLTERLCYLGLSSAQQGVVGMTDPKFLRESWVLAPLYFPGRLHVELQFRTQCKYKENSFPGQTRQKKFTKAQFLGFKPAHRQSPNLFISRLSKCTKVLLERTDGTSAHSLS